MMDLRRMYGMYIGGINIYMLESEDSTVISDFILI